MDDQVALCRVEQLFPFPYKDIADDVKEYSNAEIYWAQEEHKNQVIYYLKTVSTEQNVIIIIKYMSCSTIYI